MSEWNRTWCLVISGRKAIYGDDWECSTDDPTAEEIEKEHNYSLHRAGEELRKLGPWYGTRTGFLQLFDVREGEMRIIRNWQLRVYEINGMAQLESVVDGSGTPVEMPLPADPVSEVDVNVLRLRERGLKLDILDFGVRKAVYTASFCDMFFSELESSSLEDQRIMRVLLENYLRSCDSNERGVGKEMLKAVEKRIKYEEDDERMGEETP